MSRNLNQRAKTRWTRAAVLLGVLALLAGVIWWIGQRGSTPSHTRTKTSESLTVVLPPPPPPPPPKEPPPPREEPPPTEQAMVLQEPIAEEEPETPPVPEAPPGPDLGPGVPGGSGPATGNGGGGSGRIGAAGRANASRYGWYAAQIQRSIREALQKDPLTRSQLMNLRVRVWADAEGRVRRAVVSPPSGNPALDAHVKHQLLPGLKLSPPPPDMPMPIHLKISSIPPSR